MVSTGHEAGAREGTAYKALESSMGAFGVLEKGPALRGAAFSERWEIAVYVMFVAAAQVSTTRGSARNGH